jgi:hypothetical protein
VLSIARLTSVLLALLLVTAMATLDMRPHVNGANALFQPGFGAGLEDGPEGEEAPLAVFLNSTNGDDQIGQASHHGAIRFSYDFVGLDRGRDPAAPSHPPFAGFPTGPPAA